MNLATGAGKEMKLSTRTPTQTETLLKLNLTPTSMFESSESDDENLRLIAIFANVPRHVHGRPVLNVPPMCFERLIRQILSLPDNNNNNPPSSPNGNYPIRPVPITPLVIRREIPMPNRMHVNIHNKGFLQKLLGISTLSRMPTCMCRI